MKMLYVSSDHATLEYDDLCLFSELGIDWFSTGVYLNPKKPTESNLWRIAIQREPNEDLIGKFLELNPNHGPYKRVRLSKEFVAQFDLVLCNFSFACQQTIDDIWDSCSDVPFVFRTYCQQMGPFELKLQSYKSKGAKLVRTSARESELPNYAGHDAVIRCYVDETKYSGWVGGINKVLSFSHDFPDRINHPNFSCYREYIKNIRSKLPCELYGRKSEAVGGGGLLSWEDQMSKYRNYDVYFSLGSPPAYLTYNMIEAWMTGIPVVTYGERLGNGVGFSTYEVPDIMIPGEEGYWSDDITKLVAACNLLLSDPSLRKKWGEAGRKKSISIFGKQASKDKWVEFFNQLGFNLGV